MNLKDEVVKIGNKISNSKSVQEVDSFYSELKNKLTTRQSEITSEVKKKVGDAFVFLVDKIHDFSNEWEQNRVFPSDEKELDAAEKVSKEILGSIDKLSETELPSFFDEDYRSKVKKGLISFRVAINEEKSWLKIHSNSNESVRKNKLN